ncbi:MAG: hypothetical protein MUO34_12820 [Ignavibacteriaceae bacterium]|nr:hypothetical protein [Ignavibacteriaceae bacterium]
MNIDLTASLFHSYPKYFEKKLSSKRFAHSDILLLIKNNCKKKALHKTMLGYSIEQREIFSLEFGEGKTIVLLWSQMHGDEPTATMAMFDIFNFLNSEDEFDNFRALIKKKLRLIFVPMLNPDGAEIMIRQNAVGIDLNRDAKSLQSPESKILYGLVDKHKPDIAFNLHDQDFRWSVGTSSNLAAISLLAPVYDYDKTTNESRLKALKLIADLRNDFEKYLPGRIARYKDDYEPRSFGDMISGKNVSTILIESGRDVNDSNKTFYRKINYMMILSAFEKIICGKYNRRSENEYFYIPTNGDFLYDLILRNVNIVLKKQKYVVDIAINREEFYDNNSRIPNFISTIMDIGDLSVLNGIEEFDCTELRLVEGKISESVLHSIKELNRNKIKSFLEHGILFVKLKSISNKSRFSQLPINILRHSSSYSPKTMINTRANFNLYKGNKLVKHIINGWLCNPGEIDRINNGLIF